MWQYNPTELQHHGVKGMKWGVRKDQSISSRKRMMSKDVKKYHETEVQRARASRSYYKLKKNNASEKELKEAYDHLTLLGKKAVMANEKMNTKYSYADLMASNDVKTGKTYLQSFIHDRDLDITVYSDKTYDV
ncbi:hypothetical protein [Bacteroides sp.]|uniref:DUF7211 domain-containing protein n=1 Tax=Bacteroides sp. TaxID=29523 RepID=UPI0026342636|nr:hypothetical protein [Bacteroides sp.]MDD3040069.1 hypothetical protein [Bacteroides sp.]